MVFKGRFTGRITQHFTIVPKKTSITSLTNLGDGKMRVRWNKVSGVTGYRIRYVMGDTVQYKTVTGESSLMKTIGSLKKGKTYTVSVRAYTKIDGINYYAPYSTAVKIKIS